MHLFKSRKKLDSSGVAFAFVRQRHWQVTVIQERFHAGGTKRTLKIEYTFRISLLSLSESKRYIILGFKKGANKGLLHQLKLRKPKTMFMTIEHTAVNANPISL